MTDMICRKSMSRCQTPGMCSPHGGRRDVVTTEKDQRIAVLIAENERLESEAVYSAAGFDAARDEVARLKAEIAGLKTGYEAYERVNAELKAEVEVFRDEQKNLRSDNAQLIFALKQQEQSYLVLRGERDQLKAEVEGLDNALSVTDAAAQKWLEERTAQQSAMAEARELFDSILNDPRLVVAMPSAMLVGVKDFLSRQSAPVALGQGERS